MLLVAPSMPPNLHFVGCRGEWVADSESFGQDTWIFRIHHGIELEPDDAESSRCISIEERLIAGHLLLARLTPSRPKIDEHHFATESLGRNLMSFEILHRELREGASQSPRFDFLRLGQSCRTPTGKARPCGRQCRARLPGPEMRKGGLSKTEPGSFAEGPRHPG